MSKETDNSNFDCLRLENQLCFPLYACSKAVTHKYRAFLDPFDLTYTQYITMMVLWEEKEINVKSLGERLYLDSGTLTPLLKKLESKKLISRHRAKDDERNLIIRLTKEGEKLQEEMLVVPQEMSCCVSLEKKEAEELLRLLGKVMAGMK
ncbi:MAG: MarR family transcriptional regulator [Lachnospiraceae bacterium]|nr:MarR family transcriptional regulator [Lachnospiraceae bacterium]